MPIWLRNATSHNSTPPSRVPAATATGALVRPAMKEAVKPQISICKVGQYASSSSRGQDRRYSAKWR